MERVAVSVFHDPNLSSYKLRGWDTAKIVSGQVQTLGSTRLRLELPSHMTIAEAKELIGSELRRNSADISLRWGCTVLRDADTVRSVGLTSGATLVAEVFGAEEAAVPDARPKRGELRTRPRMVGGSTTMTVTDHDSHDAPVNDDAVKRSVPPSREVDHGRVLRAVEARQRAVRGR